MEDKERTHVSYLELSVRAENVLRENGIKFVDELTNVSSRTLLGLRNCGKISLNEIREGLAKKGLSLIDEVIDEDVKKMILYDVPMEVEKIKSQVQETVREIRFLIFKLEDICRKAKYGKKIIKE